MFTSRTWKDRVTRAILLAALVSASSHVLGGSTGAPGEVVECPRCLAVTAARQAVDARPGRSLFALRNEELDAPFRVLGVDSGSYQAYRVTDTGVDYMNAASTPVFHTSTAPTKVLVIVDVKTGRSYALHGSPSPDAAFGRLFQDLGPPIDSSEAALAVVAEYTRLVTDELTTLIRSSVEARNLVERYLLTISADEPIVTKSVSRWYKANRNALEEVAPVSVQQEADRFRVVYFSHERGTVLRTTMRIGGEPGFEVTERSRVTSKIHLPSALDGGE